jgi:hypothetical protein
MPGQSLNNALSVVAPAAEKPLSVLGVETIPTAKLGEYIARLRFHVPPAHLPFATDSNGIFAFHLWPGRDLTESPVVHVATEQQNARFVCDSIRTLPAAIWLWVCTYFTNAPDTLRRATTELAEAIPRGKHVPEALWTFLEKDPVRWDYKDEVLNSAWQIAAVGHPFAGFPNPPDEAHATDVLSKIAAFAQAHSDVPEVQSCLLATRAAAGQVTEVADCLNVLGAEFWREISELGSGDWRINGMGICEWDCTLRLLSDNVLASTPFAPLVGCSDAYRQADAEGAKRLVRVAEAFESSHDLPAALRQFRNAASLLILAGGEYPRALAIRMGQVCDGISGGSLAAELARESARQAGVAP